MICKSIKPIQQGNLFPQSHRLIRRSWIQLLTGASLLLVFLTPAASAQVSKPVPGAAVGPYLTPSQVSPFFSSQFAALGTRLQNPGNERITMQGTFVDSSGTSQAQVVLELGGKVSITWTSRPGQKIAFNGTTSGLAGAVTNATDLLQSFVDDLPETLLLAGRYGLGFRMLGPKFSNPGGYMCDLYDVPSDGQAVKGSSVQVKRYCFDSQTSLLRWVQYFAGGTAKQPIETRTDFAKWSTVNGQTVPASIVRTHAGSQLFSFQAQSILVAHSAADNSFSAQ